MPTLDGFFAAVAERWRAISPAGRAAIVVLAVVTPVVLWLASRSAGGPDMVALGVDGSLTVAARAETMQSLVARGVPVDERNGRLYVPRDERLAALATLADSRHITTDQIDFASLLEDSSPFVDRRTRNERYLVAKMNVVARMIGELDSVERASVIIDQPSRTGFGSTFVAPTASVNVLPRGSRLGPAQADAIARMVAGAHAPLDVSNVTVVDSRTGLAVNVPDAGELAPTKHLELKRTAEALVAEKVERFLSYIDGVRVAVNAQVDATEVVQHRVDMSEPVAGIIEETTHERSGGSRDEPGGSLPLTTGWTEADPGAMPSADGLDVETMTKRSLAFGQEETTTRDARGYAIKINAAVSVPRSWFDLLYESEEGPNAGQVSEDVLQTLVERETERLTASIAPLIETDAVPGAIAGIVTVDVYADAIAAAGPVTAPEITPVTAAAPPVPFAASPTKIIRTVALVSALLIIGVLIIRRVTRHDDGAEGAAGPRVAVEGGSLDDADIQYEQMIARINDLARQAPDEAAQLLRRWIRRDG